MLFSVEQAFVGRDEKRASLKTPAWEAIQGVVSKSNQEPCINDILENQKPLSLFSSNCVPPFRRCFRFLLKFSALKKFTTTGAGYRLLITSSPVGSIMFV